MIADEQKPLVILVSALEGNIFCQLLGARRHQAAVVPPGRFISMHVQGWDSNTREIVAVGQGTLDWKKIFTAAKTGAVKNYFVEMDLETMRASVPYVRKLQV
jgi:sugar phosphate isomerase/epimerase